MDQKTDSQLNQFPSSNAANETKNEGHGDEVQKLLGTLEQQRNWDGRFLCNYRSHWCPVRQFRPILSAKKYFKADDSDIILATMPKAGTTWLKALTFSIVNRDKFPISQTPLLTYNPHELIRFFEFHIYATEDDPDLSEMDKPRIFSTHVPYVLLPDSIRERESKVIYICRNPLDQFVSHRYFLLQNRFASEFDPMPLEEAFEMFSKGIHPFGPFWDHMLGYKKASLENPQKVLFLKYEDLKEDIISNVKKIAEFVGFPFSGDEEKQGVIEEIVRICNFENLKSAAEGKIIGQKLKSASFYRKGEVGDWVNYLTPDMAQRVEELMETKLVGSGVNFKI